MIKIDYRLLKEALKQWGVPDTPRNQVKVMNQLEAEFETYGFYHELVREMLENNALQENENE